MCIRDSSLANGATYTWDGEKWKASNIPDSSDVVQTTDTPVNGEILKYENGAVVWDAESSGGGLTEFTEADNEAAPNTTIHVSSLTSNAGSTNADVAIVPKGYGAFLAAVPDNTCLLYTSPSPRDRTRSRMPSSA